MSKTTNRSKIRVHVYNCMCGFQVPVPFAQQLGIGDRNNVNIEIRRQSAIVYRGQARLTSGTEIRSGDAVKKLRPGEWITVIFR